MAEYINQFDDEHRRMKVSQNQVQDQIDLAWELPFRDISTTTSVNPPGPPNGGPGCRWTPNLLTADVVHKNPPAVSTLTAQNAWPKRYNVGSLLQLLSDLMPLVHLMMQGGKC